MVLKIIEAVVRSQIPSKPEEHELAEPEAEPKTAKLISKFPNPQKTTNPLTNFDFGIRSALESLPEEIIDGRRTET